MTALIALFTLCGGFSAVVALASLAFHIAALQGSVYLTEILVLAKAVALLGPVVGAVVHATFGPLSAARTTTQATVAAALAAAWGALAVVVAGGLERSMDTWTPSIPYSAASAAAIALLAFPALRAVVDGGRARALVTLVLLLATASWGVVGFGLWALSCWHGHVLA